MWIGKNLLCCNHRGLLCGKSRMSKRFKKSEPGGGFCRTISANDCPSASGTVAQNRGVPVSTPVRACVPLLRAGWHPYTLNGVKRSVGAFVRRCRGGNFSSRNTEGSAEGITGRLGKFTQPPNEFSALRQPQFGNWVFSKSQGQGQPRGRI